MGLSNNDQFILTVFRDLLVHSQDMIFIKDKDLVYIAASRVFLEMTGLPADTDIAGRTDYDLFEPELAAKYNGDDRKVLSCGQNIEHYIEPLPDQDGRKKYSSTSKYVIFDAEGQIAGMYGIARDVTVQMELEAEKESSSLSRQMFDSVLEADLSENRMLRIEKPEWIQELEGFENSTFTEITQRLSESYIHPDSVKDFLESFDMVKIIAAYHGGTDEFNLVTKVNGKDGCRFVEFRSRVYHSRISGTVRITIFLKDIDEEIRYRQRLQKKALTDALTGLYNRESVLEHIGAYLKSVNPGELSALLFIDLDCFKQVNDHWGHQFGDDVLQETAGRLKCIFEDKDIYGRIGGDEFLVFLRNIPSAEFAVERAERVVKELSYHRKKGDKIIQITCSVGVAVSEGAKLTVDKLYEQADRAMYRAKERGRNQIYIAD